MAGKAQKQAEAAIKAAGGRRIVTRKNTFSAVKAVKNLKKTQDGGKK